MAAGTATPMYRVCQARPAQIPARRTGPHSDRFAGSSASSVATRASVSSRMNSGSVSTHQDNSVSVSERASVSGAQSFRKSEARRRCR